VLADRGIDWWDAIQALVEFEGKVFCTFETSWIVPNRYTNVVDNRLTLYGAEGGLELRNEPNLWVFIDRFHTPFSSESITCYGKVRLATEEEGGVRRFDPPPRVLAQAHRKAALWGTVATGVGTLALVLAVGGPEAAVLGQPDHDASGRDPTYPQGASSSNLVEG
jgi:hypothetical protein